MNLQTKDIFLIILVKRQYSSNAFSNGYLLV